MSIQEQAKAELDRINFGKEDTEVMLDILKRFFNQWDSGGAVWSVAPILQRLISGQPLSPITGADDEWMDRSDTAGKPMWQNMRAPSVFKDETHAWDIDGNKPEHCNITFPYDPVTKLPAEPIIEFDSEPTAAELGKAARDAGIVR